MAKDLEQDTNGMVFNFDQEVPEYKYLSLDTDIRHIKLEDVEPQPDLFCMVESIINSDIINSTTITDAVSSKSCANFYSNNNSTNSFMNTFSEIKPTTASTVSPSTLPTFLTPSSSPKLHSTISAPSSTCSTLTTNLRPNPVFSTKTNSVVMGTAEHDFTNISDNNFLIDNDSGMFDIGENLEYTDLDKQHVSLYDDYESVSNFSKIEAMPDDSKRLEEAAILMRDTIYRDCDDLNVPYNPMTWTPEHVKKWVSWVCLRNNAIDASPVLQHVDGRTLCSINQDTFSIVCGRNSGIKISNELELWKAANSCFPNQVCITNNSSSDMSNFQSQHLNNPFMERSQTFNNWPQCLSPALSSCSSNHDSNTSMTSTHSDHSDEDDSIYGSQISTKSTSVRFESQGGCNKMSTKTPTGRGHKQTIHLWQFLQELLLSKDNNFADCIRWLDRKTGIFKIEDSKKVASLWGARKNRPAMNYDKLSRSVRQYYKKGIIKKTEQSKRLVYQFCAGYL